MPEHKDLAGILKMYASFALIANTAKKANILGIGDAILDNFCHGIVSRISPEAPIPVHRVIRDEFLLGGSLNMIANVAALLAKTIYCGIVGNDDSGRIISRLLDEHKIARHLIFDDRYQTTVKTRYVSDDHDGQQMLRSDREERLPMNARSRIQLLDKLQVAANGIEMVVLSDYGKGVVDKSLLQALSKLSTTIMLDPHPKNIDLYRKFPNLFHVVTPNHKEASEMCEYEVGDPGDGDYVKSLGQKLRKIFETNIVITCGSHGALLFEKNHKAVHVPAWEVSKIFDVSGAGDTFMAALTLACVVSDVSLEQAVQFANFVASLVVQEPGTATVSAGQLYNALTQSMQSVLSRIN